MNLELKDKVIRVSRGVKGIGHGTINLLGNEETVSIIIGEKVFFQNNHRNYHLLRI